MPHQHRTRSGKIDTAFTIPAGADETSNDNVLPTRSTFCGISTNVPSEMLVTAVYRHPQGHRRIHHHRHSNVTVVTSDLTAASKLLRNRHTTQVSAPAGICQHERSPVGVCRNYLTKTFSAPKYAASSKSITKLCDQLIVRSYRIVTVPSAGSKPPISPPSV